MPGSATPSSTGAADVAPTNGPRAVAIVGPYGTGKSTLFDALLEAAGGSPRRNAARKAGTETRLAHCSHLGDAWSLLDCPGSVEFSHEAACALAVADIAVVVCDPDPARALAAAQLLRALDEAKLPHIVFINRIDTLGGRVRDTLAALQAHSTAPLVLRQVPIRTPGSDGADAVTGYVDVVSERAYRYRRGQESELIQLPAEMRDRESEAREALLEVLADHDDALLEKLLEDEQPSTSEVFARLRADLADDAVVEVLLGAAEHGNGIRRLWKALRHDTPSAATTALRRGIPVAGEPLAQVFKTIHAGHAGRVSLARIWRGTLRDGATVTVNGGPGQRIGGIHRMPLGEPAKAAEATAGELVGLGRLDAVTTGATLGENGAAITLPWPAPPAPVYALAVTTAARGDDVKLSGALQRLAEEDPSITVLQDPETGETVLRGQGEIHLNAALDRLARSSGLKLATARPAVAYRETIRGTVQQHARLKRQTGGHGQFADVKITIAPRARGEGFLFIDKVVGGAVPRQYIPAVGEAAEEAAKKGPLGHPCVDIAVTLLDGGFHSVDSSDMAFRTATRMAMQEGLAAADPVLLEPIDHVAVTVPNSFTPNAQRLLTGRRGRLLGYGEHPGWPGWDDVEALVPAAELHDLIIELRSQTQGLGHYRHHFDHLAEAPTRR
ncbi:MAG: elongation factor G [Acetobacteraceae bacterium]|nr:elongation factor G [Acetobacteraceae bacterium]